ncbi:MAG: hypothetical protein ACRDTW_04120 [Rhodococcus qingshengii]
MHPSEDDADAEHVVADRTLKSSVASADLKACARSSPRLICPLLNAFGRCPT